MKRLISLMAVVCLMVGIGCVGTSTVVHHAKRSEMIEQERSATAMLVEEDQEGNWQGMCSGVWLSDDTVLTAFHCVGNHDENGDLVFDGREIGKKIEVAYYQDYMKIDHAESIIKEAHVGIVIKSAPDADLALIKMNNVDHPHMHAVVSERDIIDGDSVMIIGHPVGFSYVWLPGTINKTEYMTNPHGKIIKMLHITSSAYFGNSGGPAFNMQGEVVGICSFLFRGPQLTFFVHRDQIVEFLNK